MKDLFNKLVDQNTPIDLVISFTGTSLGAYIFEVVSQSDVSSETFLASIGVGYLVGRIPSKNTPD